MNNLDKGHYIFYFYLYLKPYSLTEVSTIYDIYKWHRRYPHLLRWVYSSPCGYNNLVKESIKLTEGNRPYQCWYLGKKLTTTIFDWESSDMKQKIQTDENIVLVIDNIGEKGTGGACGNATIPYHVSQQEPLYAYG